MARCDMTDLVNVLDLARFQFAMTTIFHFWFVPMSIGFAVIVSVMETLYVIKKDDIYKKMTQFWAKALIISFAVGVVTGLIQEFQFGMNWSDYSRFVGDIFGAPLAIEALVAFFAESTFLGFWSFTWGKVKPWLHALFIWIVTLGSTLSAMWILVANSFMQNPVGYALNAPDHKATLNDFPALVTNPQFLIEFPHVMFGTLITGGFIVMGLSAFKLIRNKDAAVAVFFKKSIAIAASVGVLGVAGALITGDSHAFELQQMQPMKFAAMEGVDETIDSSKRADKAEPWALIAFTDPKTHKKVFSVEIPYALSILGNHSLTGGKTVGTTELEKEFQAKYGKQHPQIKDFYVPENTLFYAFRIMAMGAGALLAVLIGAFVYLRREWFGRLFNFKWYQWVLRLFDKWWLWVMAVMTFAPFIINTAGWVVTEMGRYPWTVYGVFTIADSVSPNVSVASLLISNIGYFLVFSLLGVMAFYLMVRLVQEGPDLSDEEVSEIVPQDPMANLKKEEA